MSTSTKKIVIISGGIGLLLGMFIASFLFPRIVTKRNTIISEKKILDTVFVEKDKIVIKEVEKRIVIKDTIRINSDSVFEISDSVRLDSTMVDSISDTIVQNVALVDTFDIGIDSVINAIDTSVVMNDQYTYLKSGGNDIRVSKNELVYTTIIIPEGDPSNFYCNSTKELDSLLMDHKVEKQNYEGIRVEFWASPLNTTGYQLNKKRLVLYGFYEYKHLSLKYMTDGRLGLIYFNNTYQLGCEDEFHSLIIKR